MSPKRLSSIATYWFVVLLAIQAFVGSATAQHFQFFDFLGKNGAAPDGGLIVDGAGNFYGTAFGGGSGVLGVVYEISTGPDGGAVQTVLYNFNGIGSGGDGNGPLGDLVMDQAGNLYGVTQLGGSTGNPNSQCPSEGCGTVFELSPPTVQGGAWTETILYRFQGIASDGDQPMAGLVMDASGNLYGTTSLGGIDAPACRFGCGTVFELSPPSIPGGAWTESIIYFFQGTPDGESPFGALVFDDAGNLYGTTYLGGAGGDIGGGTIFELTPPLEQGGAWSETLLHAFILNEGVEPYAGVTFSPNGVLFGTTSGGGPNAGGTVFGLKPPSKLGGAWMLEVIYNPVGSSRTPITIANAHTLYGIYESGSESIIFRISQVGGIVTITSYPLPEGRFPGGRLTLHNGALYSTTGGGGFKDRGIVFRITP